MRDEKKTFGSVLETLICAVIAFACAWLGGYISITYLVLPFLGAYIFARHDAAWGALLLVTEGVIFYFLFPKDFLIAFAMTAVPSLITGCALRRKLPAYESVLLSAGGWLIAAGAGIAYIYYAAGMNPVDWIVAGIQANIAEDESAARLLYFLMNTVWTQSGTATDLFNVLIVPIDTVRQYLADGAVINQLTNLVSIVSANLLMTTIVMGGLTSYALPRAIAKKAGTETAYIPPFKMLRLPPKTSSYVVITYLLALIPQYFDIESLMLPGILLSDAISVVLVIQGTTLICWMLSKKINRGLAVFLSILIGFIGMYFMPFIGLMDLVMKIRDRAAWSKPGDTENRQ